MADTINYPGVVFVPVSDEVDPIHLRIIWRREHKDRAIASVLRVSDEVLPAPS